MCTKTACNESSLHRSWAGRYNWWLLIIPLLAGPGEASLVTNCTEASLRAALASDTEVIFACDGIITLSSPLILTSNLFLDATGRQITLSGGSLNQVFRVPVGVMLRIRSLNIRDTRVGVDGAAVFNEGAVTLQDCILFNNGGGTNGGAIYNSGNLKLERCSFTFNVANRGGAIHNSGVLSVEDTRFYYNTARADYSSSPHPSFGGALYNLGAAAISQSVFLNNQSRGSDGAGAYANGGDGHGGAIFNVSTLNLTNTTLAQNLARGGDAGIGPFPFSFGNIGSALGGALCNQGGMVTLIHTTFASNLAQEGVGGDGTSSRGFGGNIFSTNGTVTLHNSLLTDGLASLLPIAQPSYLTKENAYGALDDGGHNLSSDASCNFSAPGSSNNTDPKIGPAGYNHASIETAALFYGSPAIDAGDPAFCPPVDQRNRPRPAGAACDIGAFELQGEDLRFTLQANQVNDLLKITLSDGQAGATYRLLCSSNFSDWSSVATNRTDLAGSTSFSDAILGPTRIYRAATP